MILKKGLEIHRSKVHEALQPFHAHMEERYREMKVVLEMEYGIKVSDKHNVFYSGHRFATSLITNPTVD